MSEQVHDPYDENYVAGDVENAAEADLPSTDDIWAPDPTGSTEKPFVPEQFTPVSIDEGMRRSGLAYSAGIAFFAATAFMLFIGWLADLVLGSSPWGLVVGIILGAAIGFFQFFRLTSQIFASDKNGSQIKPLLDRSDEKEL